MEHMRYTGTILAACALFALSSCSLVQQQSSEESTPQTSERKKPKKNRNNTPGEEVVPTPEQQQSAHEAMQTAGTEEDSAPAEASDTPPPAPVVNDTAGTEAVPGGLRMGRFAPPEEAVVFFFCVDGIYVILSGFLYQNCYFFRHNY